MEEAPAVSTTEYSMTTWSKIGIIKPNDLGPIIGWSYTFMFESGL